MKYRDSIHIILCNFVYSFSFSSIILLHHFQAFNFAALSKDDYIKSTSFFCGFNVSASRREMCPPLLHKNGTDLFPVPFASLTMLINIVYFFSLFSSAVFQNDFEDHSPPEILRRPADELLLLMKVRS